MRLNINNESKRKTYKVKSALGMESRLFPTEVSHERASFLKNLECVDGVLRKRRGWKEKYSFYDRNDKPLKINGIFKYGNEIIVHAGDSLYRCGKENEKISTSLLLADEKSEAFENGELLYILSGGELYIYDGTELVSSYNSKYAYVPVTARGISNVYEEEGDVSSEKENLLTGKRKNTLIGTKSKTAKFKLDAIVDTSAPLNATVRLNVNPLLQQEGCVQYYAFLKETARLLGDNVSGVVGISDEEQIYKILSGEGAEFNLGVVEEIMIVLKSPVKIESVNLSAAMGNTVPRVAFSVSGETVYDTLGTSSLRNLDLSSQLWGRVIDTIYLYGNHDKGIIDSINIQCHTMYTGGIEIKYNEAEGVGKDSFLPKEILTVDGRAVSLSRNQTGTIAVSPRVWLERVRDKTLMHFDYITEGDVLDKENISVEFFKEGAEKTKFYIGAIAKTDTGEGVLALSGEGSRVYFSSRDKGFCYFGQGDFVSLGAYGKISALCQMADLTLASYKENESYNISLKSDGIEVTGYSRELGSLSHFATVTVNGDTLCPTRYGIYGSRGYSGNGLFERSENIALRLKNYNLRDSVACEYKGRYYLFIDGYVFVGSAESSLTKNKELAYEWWMLDNCPVTAVSNIDGELLMGREDGRIVAFYDGYTDVCLWNMLTGSYLFGKDALGESVVYVSDDIDICSTDRLLITGGFRKLGDTGEAWLNERGNLTVVASYSAISTPKKTLRVFSGSEIYLLGKNGGFIKTRVIQVYPYNSTIELDIRENCDTYMGIYQKNHKTSYGLLERSDSYALTDEYGKGVKLIDLDNAQIVCEKSRAVECEMVSGAIVPEEIFTSKTLFAIGLSLLEEGAGQYELGYETDSSIAEKSIAQGDKISFDSFNFNTLDFNGAYNKCCYLRCFERDFKYLILKIRHSEGEAFALKEFYINYLLNA